MSVEEFGNPTTAKEIIYTLPKRFIPEKMEDGEESIFHFDLDGDDGGQFTVHITKEGCEVKEGLVGDAKCTIAAKDKIYKEIELGERKAQFALMTGKLKISDLGEMMSFMNLFKRLF